jgi:bacterioferritin (cytochrome b1)
MTNDRTYEPKDMAEAVDMLGEALNDIFGSELDGLRRDMAVLREGVRESQAFTRELLAQVTEDNRKQLDRLETFLELLRGRQNLEDPPLLLN